jgi:hypothetical protein
MKKFKSKIIKAVKNRKPFETKLVRVVLGVNPNSISILIGGYFEIWIKDKEIEVSEDISMNPNWVLNKNVINKVNVILSIYDLPQFTHGHWKWHLGKEEWTGRKVFRRINE